MLFAAFVFFDPIERAERIAGWQANDLKKPRPCPPQCPLKPPRSALRAGCAHRRREIARRRGASTRPGLTCRSAPRSASTWTRPSSLGRSQEQRLLAVFKDTAREQEALRVAQRLRLRRDDPVLRSLRVAATVVRAHQALCARKVLAVRGRERAARDGRRRRQADAREGAHVGEEEEAQEGAGRGRARAAAAAQVRGVWQGQAGGWRARKSRTTQSARSFDPA